MSREDRQILQDVHIPKTAVSRERIHELDGPQQQEHLQSENTKSYLRIVNINISPLTLVSQIPSLASFK